MDASMSKSNRRILNWVICALACTAASALPPRAVQRAELPDGCDANEYELAQCLSRVVIREEARLAEWRAKVRAALHDYQRQPFDALDDAWKKYLQATCEFDNTGAAGNSASTRFGFCKLTLMRLRSEALSKYLGAITTGDCGNDVRLFLIEYGFQCERE